MTTIEMRDERGALIFCEEPGCSELAVGSTIDALERPHPKCQEHYPFKMVCRHCGKAQ